MGSFTVNLLNLFSRHYIYIQNVHVSLYGHQFKANVLNFDDFEDLLIVISHVV